MVVAAVACGNADTTRQNRTEHTASDNGTTAVADTEAHNNADVWFVRHMIPHHQQAIEMSGLVLGKQGVDPRVTDLAGTIEATREPQIERMQSWLDRWGVTHAPADRSTLSPLTDRELRVLSEAQGADASRLFLTQMIAHDEGAISLAQTEIEEGRYPPAVTMARSIAGTWQQEVDTMKGILAAL